MMHRGAVCTDAVAGDAAERALASGCSAVEAAASGFFAAAGAYAGVLFSPAVLVVGGVGVGVRVFDGRSRQPGLDAKRPRGFIEDAEVAPVARMAVPVAPLALMVALGYSGSSGLGRAVAEGVTRAKRAGAGERGALLSGIRTLGAAALTDDRFMRSVLRVAGAAQGGLLTTADLRAVPAVDLAATHLPVDDARGLWVPPWLPSAEAFAELGPGKAHGLCAIDARGVFAALWFWRCTDGILIEELELEAPPIAVPVMRGVPRNAPGAALTHPGAVGLVEQGGEVTEAVGAVSLAPFDAAALLGASLRASRQVESRAVTLLRDGRRIE